jgi:hypothetical protein
VSEESLHLRTKLELVRIKQYEYIINLNGIKVSEENEANKEEIKELQESKRKLEQEIEKVR